MGDFGFSSGEGWGKPGGQRMTGSIAAVSAGWIVGGVGVLLACGALVWALRLRALLLEREKERDAEAPGVAGAECLELLPAPVLLLDREGRILEANRAACLLHGRTRPRLLEDGGIVPPDLIEALPAELERLASPEGGVVETFRLGAGDRMVQVELRGRLVTLGEREVILVHELDLTGWKRLEAALLDGQERYRALIGALNDGVLVVDADGKVTTANPAAERILPSNGQALVGMEVLRSGLERVTLEGGVIPAESAPVAVTLRTGEPQRGMVMGLRSESGIRWLSVNTAVLKRNPSGRVLSVLVSFADITPAVEAQRELQRAKEAAEAASQAKSEFLAHISHEIRTPLNGLTSAHDLLLSSPLSDEQRACVKTGVQLVEDMLTLLNDLLDLTKIEAGRLEIVHDRFELRPMLEASLRPFRPRVRQAGLELKLDVDEGLPGWVQGDSHRLRQVIANLVSNAVKFTPAGTVAVTVCPAGGDLVRFTVTDTGIGIAPEKLTHIFEAFRQADASISRRFGGTGLGLAICRQLVGLMQGRIWAESDAGRGSRFQFELPLPATAPRATESAVPASASRRDVPLRASARVLIVEDHPVNRQLTETMVQKLGLTTAIAGNGREALERLESEPFALVLMDVQMPELDGLAATRAWRDREVALGRPRLPIVALTAHALPQDKAACLDAGMDDYMVKPLRRDALVEVLVRHLPSRGAAKPAGGEAGVAGGVVAALASASSSPAVPGSDSTRLLRRKPVSGLTPSMLSMLHESNREGLGRVRAAVTEGNAEEAAKALHFVKGGCALLQDNDLTELLRAVEGEARSGALDGVLARLPELEERIHAVMSRLESGG